jgi:ankyrin repeat protein
MVHGRQWEAVIEFACHHPIQPPLPALQNKPLLHLAVESADPKIVKRLLEVVNPNSQDLMLNSPLHRAVYRGDVAVLAVLFEKCNPNLQDNQGNTICHLVAAIGDHALATLVLQHA